MRRKWFPFLVLVIVLALLAPATGAQGPTPQAQGPSPAPDPSQPARPDLLSEALRYGRYPAQHARPPKAGEMILSATGEYLPKADLTRWHRAIVPGTADVYAVAQSLSADPAVQYAEPDYLRRPVGSPAERVYPRPGTGPLALPGPSTDPLYVPGQLIVKCKKDVPMNMRDQALADNQMTLVKALLLPDYALIEFDPTEDVRLMAASLLDDPSVESAEPNYYRYADFIPDDPLYDLQWHFPMIQMPSAWDRSNGAGVTVAVIDSGVAYEDYGPYKQAPDLAGTTFVAGWDFVNEDSHPNDDNSHGTHVAGTIAQTTNNGMGVAGIAYGANIMPIKVLNSEGSGTDQWTADGMVWAVNHGAQVLNLSLGGSAPSSVLESAVNYAYDNGVTVVAAAGNDNSAVGYPAAYENCIAVGAVRYDQTRSDYSNYGPALDVVAPGGDLDVDQNGDGQPDGVLQQTFNPNTQDYTDFNYWPFQGTSMAAPHVSGVAALLTAYGNGTTPDEVRAALENTAKDRGPAGWDEEYGHGLIQANDALHRVTYEGCLVLDGVDDYAETEDHSELDVGDEGGESLTIEAWVYIQRSGFLSERLYVVNKSQSYELYANRYSDYSIPPKTYGCIGFLLTAPSGQPGGFEHCHWPPHSLGWHHVAGVFYKETGEMRIYMDGEAFGGPSYFGPAINNSTEGLEVGGGFERLPGAVDEVRISDVARYTVLTYTVPTSAFTCDEHTHALWHFDECEGATIFHDACGVDNVLTGHNGAHTEGGTVEIVEQHRLYLPLILRGYQ